jgi:quercetin dioxygenase-like cupin family protein
MTSSFQLTPSETVTVHAHTPETLEVEGVWGPKGSPPPRHFHPAQDERFEVLAGTLRARVDGTDHELVAGDVLEIPRGAVHQIWNQGDEPARALWRTSPAGRTAEWFAAIDGAMRASRARGAARPGPLELGGHLAEYRDVFRLAGPQLLVAPFVALLALAGRARRAG